MNNALGVRNQVRAIRGRGPARGYIELLVELTNRGVGGKSLRVAAVVEVHLRFAIRERIDVDANARRPIISKYILLVGTVQFLLLPADAGVQRDTAAYGKGVIDIAGEITLVRRRLIAAEETT